MRNRAMEALEALSDGDVGVRDVGVGEYVEQFFDVISDDIPWRWRVALEVSTSTVCRSVLTPPGPGGHPSVGGS
jgi:hypothetical protein